MIVELMHTRSLLQSVVISNVSKLENLLKPIFWWAFFMVEIN